MLATAKQIAPAPFTGVTLRLRSKWYRFPPLDGTVIEFRPVRRSKATLCKPAPYTGVTLKLHSDWYRYTIAGPAWNDGDVARASMSYEAWREAEPADKWRYVP